MSADAAAVEVFAASAAREAEMSVHDLRASLAVLLGVPVEQVDITVSGTRGRTVSTRIGWRVRP
jgi:hypothetical protein